MNFLKHFCTHATSLKKQMAGKLVSVHPYIHHFCFGRKFVRILRQIAAFLCKSRQKPVLFYPVRDCSNHLVAILRIGH
ncbi:MAG: hypothetical protein RI983_1627 [Bacteroidota bacterium]